MNEQDTTRRGLTAWLDDLDGQIPPDSPFKDWFREWLYGEPDDIETDLALANEGHFHLIPRSSPVFMLKPYSEIFSRQLEEQSLFRDPYMIWRYVFLDRKGVAPSLQLPPEELSESMDNAARTYLASCSIHTSLPSDTMWSILKTPLEDEARSYLFKAGETETEPNIQKNFPLGKVFGEITVSGLGKRMDPVEATKALVGGLIGRRRESLLAAEEVFDKEKLAQARLWIANSDLAPEKLFRAIRPHLERGDGEGARHILEYFAGIPNHAVNDLVSGILGLFNGEEPFSRLELKMQNCTFADMFDNTRLMSCTFLPSGMYAGASFRYQFDPDIGLLHIVPTAVDKKLNPIGVVILVNAVDESGNKWLVVDSVEGGLDLERVRDSLWIPAVYKAVLSIGREVGAQYVLFNNKVYNGGRPKRFLEYVAKRHPSGEPLLEKAGLQDFSYPGVPADHVNEALETWGEGQTIGRTNGYIATLKRLNAAVETREIEWQKDGQVVLALEQSAFAPSVRSDEQDFQEQLEKGSGIIIYHAGEPAGYAIRTPLEKVSYPGCLEDSHRNLEDTAYIESLAVKTHTSPLIFRRLARSLVETLKEKDIHRITMHVQTDTPWYQFLLRAGARELNRYDNWQGWEKTYSYLEFLLTEV